MRFSFQLSSILVPTNHEILFLGSVLGRIGSVLGCVGGFLEQFGASRNVLECFVHVLGRLRTVLAGPRNAQKQLGHGKSVFSVVLEARGGGI